MMTYEEMLQVSAVERGALRTETDWRKYFGRIKTICELDSAGCPAVVGFVAYRVESEVLRIDQVAIAPGLQRSGLGRALLMSLQSKFPELLMVADVPSGEPGLIRFFGRCGFRSVANLSQMKNGRNMARLCCDPGEFEPQTFEVA